MRRRLWLAACGLAIMAGLVAPVIAQGQQAPTGPGSAVVPPYDIWSVKLGGSIEDIPDSQIAFAACGTDGGPPTGSLESVADFAKCPAEQSGLHEVYFEYDDEQAYIAKALQSQFPVLQGGTSMFGHPVIVSVLADDKGIVQGIRAVTDDRASLDDRTAAVTLETGLKGHFGSWNLSCQKLPPENGETPIGKLFVHDVCVGQDAGGNRVRIESHYFRKKGQTGIDTQTARRTQGDFDSSTRFEETRAPYAPTETAPS